MTRNGMKIHSINRIKDMSVLNAIEITQRRVCPKTATSTICLNNDAWHRDDLLRLAYPCVSLQPIASFQDAVQQLLVNSSYKRVCRYLRIRFFLYFTVLK